MPSLKTSALPNAASLTGSEVLGIVQSSGNVKTTLGDVASYVSTSLPGRNQASLQAQWVTGATVEADTVYLAFKTPYAGTIGSMDYFTGPGNFTVTISINGTSVTGLTGIVVTSSAPTNATATAANTFSAGSKITAVISNVYGPPTDALINLNITWT